MRLYHRTSAAEAATILPGGFVDREDTYGTPLVHRGVWLSDAPLGPAEGAAGDTLLAVEVDLSLDELEDHEWSEEGKPHREFLIPATLLNGRCIIRMAPVGV